MFTPLNWLFNLLFSSAGCGHVYVSTSLVAFKNVLKTVRLDNECCSSMILCDLFISPSDVL